MTELTEDQQTAFDYLGIQSNKITLEKRRELWENNAKENRKHYIKGNPELPGLIIFIIAAGSSLTRNVKDLKLIPKNSRGYIMACDASLPCLFDSGIIPDYCISIDGDGRMWEMVNDSPSVDTSKVTLLCTTSASPSLTDNWKGPKYFFANRTATTELDSKLFYISRLHTAKKDIKIGEEISSDDVEMVFGGILPRLQPGGNVTASALQLAMHDFGAKKIVFVGQDFSWRDENAFYAGHANREMGIERINSERHQTHLDVYGREVITNMSLFNFKYIHENYAKAYKNVFVNATEGGIFGINEDGSKMEEMEFLTLEQSIEKYVLG